jgi:phage terminase small subunit
MFVNEYLVHRNATKAAIAAGYSAKTAHQAGSRLLRNVKVREKLDALNSQRVERLELSADRVLQGLTTLAFFDVRRFFNKDGSVKGVVDLDLQTAMALRGIEVTTTERREKKEGQDETVKISSFVTKIRLADRGENLERLGRHLKLFTDKVEVEHPSIDNPEARIARIMELLERARERAGKAFKPN